MQQNNSASTINMHDQATSTIKMYLFTLFKLGSWLWLEIAAGFPAWVGHDIVPTRNLVADKVDSVANPPTPLRLAEQQAPR